MNSKTVSVVILSYNNVHLLNGAIESVLKQNYPYIEVIIQDDHSIEFEEERIRSAFENKRENIVNVLINRNEENVGTVRSFNNAVKISSGEIIVPLACDDRFYDESVISDVVKFFEKTNCCVCSGLRCGMDSKDIQPNKKLIEEFCSMDETFQICRLYYSNFFSGSTLYYNKKFLKEQGCFDEDFTLLEDYPIVLKVYNTGNHIDFMDRITIWYCEDGISKKTKKVHPKLKTDFKRVYEKIIFKDERIVKRKRMKRYLEYRYSKNYLCSNVLELLLTMLKYSDVIFLKFYMKVLNRFTRKYGSEFELYMN